MKKKKYTIEFIKEEFSKSGLQLLTTEYKNQRQKLEFTCSNHIDKGILSISWDAFINQNQGCRYCSLEKQADQRRHDYSFVKSIFESRNLILLEDIYINAHTKMKYICNIHNDKIQEIDFKQLYHKGQGCRDCSSKRKLNIEIINNEFRQRGFTLLTETYKNTQQKLEYICPSHPNEIQSITYSNFYSGHGCKFCALEYKASKRRMDFDIVKEYFLNNDYILLENKYINNQTPMKFICKKHPNEIQTVNYGDIKQGHGCKHCGYKKMSQKVSGSNHHNWKGNKALTLFLRENLKQWKKDSMETCGYRCVITGFYFDVIHHLVPFHKIIEEVLFETNIPLYEKIEQYSDEQLKLLKEKCIELHYRYPLGVCLTKEMHVEFHSTYGNNCTPEDFEEFKMNKIKELEKLRDVS
jgi:hypothetical protein